ncbi:MAG: AgmX/PglI C-terminal domain-containing protein [Bdellovibrionales bacterium]
MKTKTRFFLVYLVGTALVGCAMKHKRGANVDAVIETYRQNKSSAEACYRQGLKEDPALGGKVVLSWKVGPAGKANNAKIERSDLANATVEKCLLDHLNGLTFPSQAKFSPALVEFELDFTHLKSERSKKP